MENQKTVDVLNTLITINNDRIEGYETASKETDEQDLIAMFANFMATSKKCKQELVNEVIRLDGTPAEGTRTTGKFFRVWMNVKAALTGKDRKAILNSCEYGEDKAQQTYSEALKNDLEHLSADQQTMINKQKMFLRSDHQYVKSLRDALVDAQLN